MKDVRHQMHTHTYIQKQLHTGEEETIFLILWVNYYELLIRLYTNDGLTFLVHRLCCDLNDNFLRKN